MAGILIRNIFSFQTIFKLIDVLFLNSRLCDFLFFFFIIRNAIILD